MTATRAAALHVDGPMKPTIDDSGRYATVAEAMCGTFTVEVQKWTSPDGTEADWNLYSTSPGPAYGGDSVDVCGFSPDDFVRRIRNVAAALNAAADLLDEVIQ